jgi:hypothetical protein
MNPIKWLLPRGRTPRTVQAGPYAGLRLQLDLRSEFLIWLGTYEAETFNDLRRLLQDCRGAVDLGAAKGDLTLLCLRAPGMERVVAVEPLEHEREQFAGNLALNGLAKDPRVIVHAGFAGRGEAPLWRTLDDLASGVPGPIFIKIDIDGPEAEVLADGITTLRTQDCRLLIETHSPEAERGCADLLRGLGYTVKIISPAWWRTFVPELRPLLHNRWLAAWREPVV